MTMPWTPTERAEMAAADAEIEATFRLTYAEVQASEWRDLIAVCERTGRDPKAERARRERENARNRTWYAKNREREREKARKRYEANRDEVNAKRRKWYAENRERILAQQKAHRDRKKAEREASA